MKNIYIILCLFTNIAFTQVTFENISLPTEVATKNFYSISKQGSILYNASLKRVDVLKTIDNAKIDIAIYLEVHAVYFFRGF